MPIPTNPWLTHPIHRNPNPAPNASFVEYLRWMRILRENPDGDSQIGLVNNGEVLELLDQILSNSDYSERLKELTQRTRRIAQFSFEATSTWRLRVGGMRGPESMLLPAFDALGMPIIPSTTLKGIARSIAERELTKKEPSITKEQIRDIFGEIEPTACLGKVIFLDAYPLPFTGIDSDDPEELEGLVPDIANSIWTWDNNNPQYKTNPNIFLSLRKPTFVIGLRLVTGADPAMLEHVKKWLYEGLAQGIGSRVNSGYGTFTITNQTEQPKGAKQILSVKFQLRGQLIHGRQNFNAWVEKKDKPEWKPPGIAQSEIRSPAFRSILRYWFRTLALGVLEPNIVKEWELKIFGGIEPEARMGMFQLEIPDGKIIRDNANKKDENCGYATGTLILRQSQTTKQLSTEQKKALQNLLASLTWLTFHLGGVGQGARRPCYSRQNRQHAPWWRGTSVKLISEDKEDKYWNCPSTIENLQNRFRTALNTFYTSLSTLIQLPCNPNEPKTAAKSGNWAEAVDTNCRIICVQGDITNDKSPALALLHKQARQSGSGYDRQLCGSINERSPIWVARVGSAFKDDEGFNQKGFDIVTIFGVDNPKRKQYLNSLTQPQYPIQQYREIWRL